jgi:heme/copper-type cytochrome/quinol oxidase subunit 4
MTHDNRRPWDHPEIALANGVQYLAGFVVSLGLLGVGLFLVGAHAFPPATLLASVACLAILTVVAQLILLFHLDFSETQRWNTLSLILNVPLLALSVGLTLWMFRELAVHVMPAMGMHGMTMP